MSSHLNDWTGKLLHYLLCCCWRSLPNRKRVVISCFHSPPIWLSLRWGQPATTSVLVLDLALMQTFLFFCFCFASSFGSYCVPALLNQSHVHWLFPDTDGILECLLCDWAAISPQSHKQSVFSLYLHESLVGWLMLCMQERTPRFCFNKIIQHLQEKSHKMFAVQKTE